MNVSDVMTPSPYRLRLSATLQEAGELMDKHLLGCLPVVDEHGELAGMLTDRDVCVAAAAEGVALSELGLAPHMTSRVYKCRADDSLTTAAELMRLHRVRRLAVTDDEGKLVGIISLDDLVHAREELSDDEIVRTLAAVAPPRAYG